MMEHQPNFNCRDENFSPQSRSTCHFGEENEIHPSNFRHFSQSSNSFTYYRAGILYAASSTSLSHAHLNSVSFQHARPIFREITFRRSRQNTLYSQERTNSSTSDARAVCNFPHRALSRAKNYTSASRGI
jgi:hypothetical protein